MEMRATLGEVELAQVRAGTDAVVTPVGSPRHYPGKVWQVSPVIDPQTRQGVVRISLAWSPELRAGGFASAVIHAGMIAAPMLPDSALLSDGNTSYVYIVDAHNKAERRNVKIGAVSEHGIAVIQGLSGSERVVLRAGGFLSGGETVNPVMARR
jgi:multidrug efflux pump subunit AcrA (membrane-fusion protein)